MNADERRSSESVEPLDYRSPAPPEPEEPVFLKQWVGVAWTVTGAVLIGWIILAVAVSEFQAHTVIGLSPKFDPSTHLATIVGSVITLLVSAVCGIFWLGVFDSARADRLRLSPTHRLGMVVYAIGMVGWLCLMLYWMI